MVLFVSHLKDKGLIVKEGSLVDASFVDVPREEQERFIRDYFAGDSYQRASKYDRRES